MPRLARIKILGHVKSTAVAVILFVTMCSMSVAQTVIHGPSGSIDFGVSVTVLPNGNIVVVDDSGPVSDVGAVYLYGPDGSLISVLTGSSTNDQVGSGGITVLSDGNFVVCSPFWNNGSVQGAGAVTWVNGNTGLTDVVSVGNSLVGTSTNDYVCLGTPYSSVKALENGHYVVLSVNWANGSTSYAGAVTWLNGGAPFSGSPSAANSLVGTHGGDLANAAVVALTNGNYVVASPQWNGGIGAVTWGSGSSGVAGEIGPGTSLVGSVAGDSIGNYGVVALATGNYVVDSPSWSNGVTTAAGAVTWGNGSTGTKGLVSASNSLVGTTAQDQIGSKGVTALTNGNYVVASPQWSGIGASVGAATWGNGISGTFGIVSTLNSLVGSTPGDLVASESNDQVGYALGGITALANGNYVVASPNWHDGSAGWVGAVTWGNGADGTKGAVSTSNSLVGSTPGDFIGGMQYDYTGIYPLSNGNYVVASPYWSNGADAHAGAVTWAIGSAPLVGTVSTANSLFGAAGDFVGSYGVAALKNGNYVVKSANWSHNGASNVGAATWGDGSSGLDGMVSAANSLIGSYANAYVGSAITVLANGNYVVNSAWSNAGVNYLGAATWLDGRVPFSGVVSSVNSLVGGSDSDELGSGGITALVNGDYIIRTPAFDYVKTTDAGAISLGRGRGGTVGAVDGTNSVVGQSAGAGQKLTFAYDAARDTLIVGSPLDETVTLFKADLLFKNGFN